ncbi:MAG: tetratricopeptide repeat protein [Acidiferrobacter sp.]
MRERLRLSITLLAVLAGGCASMPVAPPSPVKPAAPAVVPRSLKDRLFYHVLVGDIAGQQGHLGIAAAAFGKAAQESGDRALARRSAQLALYARHYHQGLRLAQLWVAAEPTSAGAYEALADADVGVGLPGPAVAAFEHALQLVGRHQGAGGRAFAFEHIATLLWRLRPHLKVLAVMQTLARRYPQEPVAQYALADLARRRSAAALAIRAIDRALVLKPRWEDAAVLKARILWAHTPRASLAFATRFLHRNPDATRLRLDYARRLVSLQYWHKALAQFRRIAKAAPNDPQVLYTTALVALKAQAPRVAARDLKQTLVLAPNDTHARLYLGEIAERAHRFARAAQWYRGVGAPYQFAASVRLALIPLHEGHPHKARARLLRLIARDRHQRTTLALARDQADSALHDYPAALAALNQAMTSAHPPAALLYARALTEEKLGEIPAMIADLQALLVRHPQDPIALNALGYTFISQHLHPKQGLQLVRKALRLEPKNPYILDSVGWAYYEAHDPVTALSYLQRAVTLSHDATIATHLGVVLWSLGDQHAAQLVWQAAHRRDPHSKVVNGVLKKHDL